VARSSAARASASRSTVDEGATVGLTISPRTGEVAAGSLSRTSSSFMPFISLLKMRIERPIEREASGSFL
jgi:hypothetical protein